MDKNAQNIKSCFIINFDGSSKDVSGSDVESFTGIRNIDIAVDLSDNINVKCSNPNEEKSMDFSQPTLIEQNIKDDKTKSTIAYKSNTEKKPSYLNLACCINGYSNITTYNSKIRQEISKSREVSPLRSSYNSVLHNTKNNGYASPVLLCDAPNRKTGNDSSEQTGMQVTGNNTALNEEVRNTSFIQERVERLYGPGAFAPTFFSQQKLNNKNLQNCKSFNKEQFNINNISLKSKQISPEKDINKLKTNNISNDDEKVIGNQECFNKSYDIPVLRHLSQEFRNQLSTISPKTNKECNVSSALQATTSSIQNLMIDEVDKKLKETDLSSKNYENNFNDSSKFATKNKEILQDCESKNISEISIKHKAEEKDGNFFLDILRKEQNRLLCLSLDAEKNIEQISSQPDLHEDVLGILRSAVGKARLLVSQKMRQFEDLCFKNLNQSSDDPFLTTVDDLQGFWDLIYIQIHEIDKLFGEIEIIKNNNWKMSYGNSNSPQQIPVKQNMQSKQKILKSSTKSAAAIKRDIQRKELIEIKRKSRNKIIADLSKSSMLPILNDKVNTVNIFVKDSNHLPVKPKPLE